MIIGQFKTFKQNRFSHRPTPHSIVCLSARSCKLIRSPFDASRQLVSIQSNELFPLNLKEVHSNSIFFIFSLIKTKKMNYFWLFFFSVAQSSIIPFFFFCLLNDYVLFPSIVLSPFPAPSLTLFISSLLLN